TRATIRRRPYRDPRRAWRRSVRPRSRRPRGRDGARRRHGVPSGDARRAGGAGAGRTRAAGGAAVLAGAGPRARRGLAAGGGAGAAVAALPPETTLIASAGFAGALAPGLVPGEVILASEIVWEEGGRVHRHATAPAVLDAVVRALTDTLGAAPRVGGVLSS